jgi:hypothetical protein
MEATILLSKAMGLCLIVIGAAIIPRRRYFLSVFAAYAEQRLVRTVASMIELTVGLLLVVNNLWSPLPAAVITLIGWMAVAEAVAYLFLPGVLVARVIGTFNTGLLHRRRYARDSGRLVPCWFRLCLVVNATPSERTFAF